MIYLASKSPRRRELLRQIGVEFELLQLRSDGRRGMDVTEEVLRGETPEVYVARVAHEKAHFALRMVRLRNMGASSASPVASRKRAACWNCCRAAPIRY
ncbi:MAG: Maf family protein [Rhodospirillaceae bacterium]|nr:Maf family protein [Rhodospirillaceae bacterium]